MPPTRNRTACAATSPTTATATSRCTCAAPSHARWATRWRCSTGPSSASRRSGSGFNNCHRTMPELVEAVKRGVLAAGGLPLDFPTISLGEIFLSPTSLMFRNLMSMDTEEMIRAQPMDAVRADRRLRQDRAGAADGCGVGRSAGDPAGHRADAGDAVARRAAGRVHRLPALLGEVPRRRHRATTRSTKSRATSRPPPAPAR